MLRTFWRKLHLILALVAALFLIIASVTGAILAFEPIEKELHPYRVKNADEITIAAFIETLDSTYAEVELLEAEMDENGFMKLSIIDEEGEMQSFYINAETGQKLGNSNKPKTIYDFSRKLHRSLFLGSLGRLTMGIVSAILVLIIISGIALIIKRQLGVKRFFSGVTRDHFFQYIHVVLGRFTFPLIIVIAITGAYLSLDRFGFLPKENKVKHNVDFESLADTPEIHKYEFPVFKNTTLDQVQKIQFPFTPFPEDYFQLRLEDKDIIVNQYTGGVESVQKLGEIRAWNNWMFNLHTGQGSITWSLLLLFGSISIFVFVVSGFVITAKRLRGKTINKTKKEDAEVVILVGSENGSTGIFARHFRKLLQKRNIPVYMTALNNYTAFPKMKQLVVLTSTYGDGDPPSNASKFLNKFQKGMPEHPFQFSVVAFGSEDYAQFCKFGADVHKALSSCSVADSFLPLVKVNKQADEQRMGWLKAWSQKFNIDLTLEEQKIELPGFKFKVVGITEPTERNHQHYTVQLKSTKAQFRSGDLFVVKPPADKTERFYSIGTTEDGSILLSIRKHENGICSSYLSSLKQGDTIKARIQQNPSFHFPENTKRILAIANGTGVAPFLGMAHENAGKIPMKILWGMKSKEISNLYSKTLEQLKESGALETLTMVYSAEPDRKKEYVQDVLSDNINEISQLLKEGGVILICGSLAMRDAVFAQLKTLLESNSNLNLNKFIEKGQVLSDCY